MLSAVLVPFDSNRFMLRPWAMSFFHKLCPAPLPTVTQVQRGDSGAGLSLFISLGHHNKVPRLGSLSEVTQSCPTLCDPTNCSPPGSSLHGIFQAKVLEWVAISFSRGSSRTKDGTCISCPAGRFFTTEPHRKHAIMCLYRKKKNWGSLK